MAKAKKNDKREVAQMTLPLIYSEKDVKTYAIHPAHVAVAKELIGPYKADRACVDYEY